MNEIRKKTNEYLKELHLSQIRNEYESVAETARKENSSYEEYLYELLKQQCLTRHNNRIERLLLESRLPLEKNFDNFNLKRLPSRVIQQVKILVEGSFVEHKENVLAFGKPGRGKTHLLCAIGQKLIRSGKRVYFKSCGFLIQDLLRAKQELKLSKMLKSLSRYDVLILDDIGYVQQSREEMEVFFSLIGERYERGSIMLTSNLQFSKWESIFKDAMITAAVIDRLVHHCVILDLDITSYRLEEAEKNKEKKGGEKPKH